MLSLASFFLQTVHIITFSYVDDAENIKSLRKILLSFCFLITKKVKMQKLNLLAVCGRGLGLIRTVEELPVEELDPHHGEDEEEQHVHDQDVEHIS